MFKDIFMLFTQAEARQRFVQHSDSAFHWAVMCTHNNSNKTSHCSNAMSRVECEASGGQQRAHTEKKQPKLYTFNFTINVKVLTTPRRRFFSRVTLCPDCSEHRSGVFGHNCNVCKLFNSPGHRDSAGSFRDISCKLSGHISMWLVHGD